MKLFALIIAASAALAPMQAYASTGSEQSLAQVQNAQPQLAWGETCSNDEGALVNVQICGNDIL
jgi:hypothetical protein